MSNANGAKMMQKGVDIAADEPNYGLFNHNCDHVALEILAAGGVSLDKHLLPNNTYGDNK